MFYYCYFSLILVPKEFRRVTLVQKCSDVDIRNFTCESTWSLCNGLGASIKWSLRDHLYMASELFSIYRKHCIIVHCEQNRNKCFLLHRLFISLQVSILTLSEPYWGSTNFTYDILIGLKNANKLRITAHSYSISRCVSKSLKVSSKWEKRKRNSIKYEWVISDFLEPDLF